MPFTPALERSAISAQLSPLFPDHRNSFDPLPQMTEPSAAQA
jgi:hypothetical protein